MSIAGIDSFDIFDVDIGKAYRRLPDGGWMPTDKARRIVNDYNHAPNRLIGTFMVPQGLHHGWARLNNPLAQDDPFGRRERERLVQMANDTMPPYEFDGSYRAEFNQHLAPIIDLGIIPQVIYEIIYPVRALGSGKLLHSPMFSQRISLEFDNPDEFTTALVVLDPLDKS